MFFLRGYSHSNRPYVPITFILRNVLSILHLLFAEIVPLIPMANLLLGRSAAGYHRPAAPSETSTARESSLCWRLQVNPHKA